MSSLESKIQADFIDWAEKQPWIWIVKYPGGTFGKTGTPDILMSVMGLFVAIEMKRPKGDIRAMQEYQRKRIMRSGGICEFRNTLEGAKELVLEAKAKAERLLA